MGVLAGDAGNVNVSGLMGVDEDGVVVVGTCNGVPSGVVPGPQQSQPVSAYPIAAPIPPKTAPTASVLAS